MTTSHPALPAALDALPMFPLPGMSFFPDTMLPLHIFEPRYRAMVEYCIERESPLAMVRIEPGHESEHLAHPPIAAIAGVGAIVGHERLPDGRYHLLLEGIARVRIVEELDADWPFRMARARLLPDAWPDDRAALGARVTTLQQCLSQIVARAPEVAGAIHQTVQRANDAGELSNLLASVLVTDDDARQVLLECVDVERRLELLVEHVAAVLAGLADGTAH